MGHIIEQARAIRQYIEKNAVSLTDAEALDLPEVFPTWCEDKHYRMGDRVRFGGSFLYKCLQEHDAQASWTPTLAPSLWAMVLIPDPGEIPDWVQPDSTNPYMTGDRVRHVGYIWRSLVDNNVWEPSESVPTLWEQE